VEEQVASTFHFPDEQISATFCAAPAQVSVAGGLHD